MRGRRWEKAIAERQEIGGLKKDANHWKEDAKAASREIPRKQENVSRRYVRKGF